MRDSWLTLVGRTLRGLLSDISVSSLRQATSSRACAKTVQWLLALASVLFVAWGLLAQSPVALAWGVFLLYGFGLVYICQDIHSRILLLFLFIGIFLFWLTRPLIGMLYQTEAWFGATFESTSFALMAVYVSIAFLVGGSAAFTALRKRPYEVQSLGGVNGVRGKRARPVLEASFPLSPNDTSIWVRALRISSLAAYAICFSAAMLYGFQLLSYMSGLSYEEYYLTSTSAYASSTLSSVAGLAPTAMCVYLATMPRRSTATVILCANVLTTFPKLIIGARTDFVMAALFFVFYYLVRNARDGRGSWIGRKEIAFVLVAVPVGILFLGSLNYIRAGGSVGPQGILLQVADALYKQGVTFKVLEYGYEVQPLVSDLGFKFYSLGSLLTTVTQGFIGQLFLRCDLLPDINSTTLALEGFSYSHAMSFFAHPNYLGGEGYGSSYVLELFADFGFLGIIAGSLLIGYLFSFFATRIGSSWLFTTIIFMGARRVFHMPRGEFIEWASCLWSTRFWLAIVLIAIAALVIYALIFKADKMRLGLVGVPSFVVLAHCSHDADARLARLSLRSKGVARPSCSQGKAGKRKSIFLRKGKGGLE